MKKQKFNKIINLQNLKDHKKFEKYLTLLPFNELINETKSTVEELKSEPLNTDLAQRSTLLLKEFNYRLKCVNDPIFSDESFESFAQSTIYE